MKIGLVTPLISDFGGVGYVVKRNMKVCSDHGHDVKLITLSDESSSLSDFRIRNFIPIDLKLRNSWSNKLKAIFHILDYLNFLSFLSFVLTLRRQKFDVIHIHKLKGFSPLVIIAAKLISKKVVVSCHDHELINPDAALSSRVGGFFSRNWIAKKLYLLPRTISILFSDVVTYPSIYLRDNIVNDIPCIIRKSVIVENPCDIYDNVPDDTMKVTNETIRLVYLGRLKRDKGVLELFKLSDFFEKHNITLDIYGYGDLENEIKHRSCNNKNISFKGSLDGEYKRVLSSYDFLINPSLCKESFGLVIIESFSFGVRVIVNNVGALPELVKSSNFGYVYNDILELKEILRKSHKKITRDMLIDFSKKFSIRNYYVRLEEIYK